MCEEATGAGGGGAGGGGRDAEPKTRTPHKDVGNNIHKVQQEEASEGTGKGKTKEFNIQQLVALKK